MPVVAAGLGELDLLVGVHQRLGGMARRAVEPRQRVVGERAHPPVDVLDVAPQRVGERRRRPPVVAGVAVGVRQVDRVEDLRGRIGVGTALELARCTPRGARSPGRSCRSPNTPAPGRGRARSARRGPAGPPSRGRARASRSRRRCCPAGWRSSRAPPGPGPRSRRRGRPRRLCRAARSSSSATSSRSSPIWTSAPSTRSAGVTGSRGGSSGSSTRRAYPSQATIRRSCRSAPRCGASAS